MCGLLLPLALWAVIHGSFDDWEKPPDISAEVPTYQAVNLDVSQYSEAGTSTIYPGTI